MLSSHSLSLMHILTFFVYHFQLDANFVLMPSFVCTWLGVIFLLIKFKIDALIIPSFRQLWSSKFILNNLTNYSFLREWKSDITRNLHTVLSKLYVNGFHPFSLFRCVQWYVLEKNIWAVPLYQGIITLFVIMNFSLATFMDPGVIPRGKRVDFYKLIWELRHLIKFLLVNLLLLLF